MSDRQIRARADRSREVDPDQLAEVQARALPGRTVDRLSRLFSALSDPTRLRILHALSEARELCVCDVAAVTAISISAASHQLRLLRDRELVSARRDGRQVYYSITDEHVARLLRCGEEHATEA